MMTLSRINALLASGSIDAAEAAELRAERLAHLEAQADTPAGTTATKSTAKQPEPEADAPPKEERKKKKVAKSTSSAAKSQPQPEEKAEAFQVLKISIPGAELVEYCPRDMHYFGPTRGRAGFHTFRFGSNFYHRTVEQWSVLAREYYSERIGAWIRKCIAMNS